MFAYPLEFYALAAVVVTLTGISKAGFGAGVEMAAVPALALLIAPQTAAAILLPILFAIDCANLWRYRHDWQSRLLILLVPAALVGIAVGAATFRFFNADALKLGLGVLALAFAAQRLLQNTQSAKRPGRAISLVLGAMGGFTSFVAHAGSPPIKMILLSEGLDKRQFVGTNSYLFASINFLKIFPYFFLGQLSAENLTTSATLAPFVVLGVLLGFWLNGIVSQRWFNAIVLWSLALIGLKLVYDGVVALA